MAIALPLPRSRAPRNGWQRTTYQCGRIRVAYARGDYANVFPFVATDQRHFRLGELTEWDAAGRPERAGSITEAPFTSQWGSKNVGNGRETTPIRRRNFLSAERGTNPAEGAKDSRQIPRERNQPIGVSDTVANAEVFWRITPESSMKK